MRIPDSAIHISSLRYGLMLGPVLLKPVSLSSPRQILPRISLNIHIYISQNSQLGGEGKKRVGVAYVGGGDVRHARALDQVKTGRTWGGTDFSLSIFVFIFKLVLRHADYQNNFKSLSAFFFFFFQGPPRYELLFNH